MNELYCNASVPLQESVIGASFLLGTVIPYLVKDKLHGGVMPYLTYIHESYNSSDSKYCLWLSHDSKIFVEYKKKL